MKVNTANLANPKNLIETLSKRQRPVANFIKMQESEADFSSIRLGQDVAVNWVPKVIFSRSTADFADVTFLEFTENLLVYLGPKLLGENLFRKLYSSKLDTRLKKMVSTPAEKLLQDKNLKSEDAKKLMPIKAAIAISALAIPLCEYALNYVKNLFTLKVFKQADFNNIANLKKQKTKDKIEDKKIQTKVEKSANKHLKITGAIYAGCLALSALLVTRGRNSKVLQSISEAVLRPGNKLFKNNAKKAETFNKYFSLEFADKNGKLALSRGQLTSCVLIGGIGYFGSAKDRGKQNFLEVLFRFPLVGFYIITGSEMFEKVFKSILRKNGKCKEILEAEKTDKKMPKLTELPELAKRLAIKNGTCAEAEYKRLFKQKSTIVMAPFLFSLGFMGLFVAGISRYFTQYRYNKEQAKANGKR